MSSIFNFNSVSDFLAHELDRRKQKNQHYSLRAFSRDLGISASRLSEVLNSSAGLSESMALQIATRLKLKLVEKKYWLDLILANTARNPKVKSLALQRIETAKGSARIKEIKESEFCVIADWYHSAIIELTEMKGFQSDAVWISHQLGISFTTAEAAVDRLLKLKLLIKKDGRWLANSEALQTASEAPSLAIQKFHHQILTKTLDSLRNDKVTDRQMQSMIVAIPRSQIPLFNEKMKVFMQRFWEDIKDSEKDDLYSVSIQLCPVRARAVREQE